MKTTQEMIKVMQAYADGKKIQYSSKGVDWTDVIEPSWDWESTNYRVKPEPKPPTYRPYESADELIADYKARFNVDNPPYTMPQIWVKQINSLRDKGSLIVSFDQDRVWLGAHDRANDFDNLFSKYTYLDGSPVGKLVEE